MAAKVLQSVVDDVQLCGHELCPSRSEPGMARGLTPEQCQVTVHHRGDEVSEGDLRAPAEALMRPRRVSLKNIDLGGTVELRIHDHMLTPVPANMAEGGLDEFLDAVHLARADNVIVRLLLLE